MNTVWCKIFCQPWPQTTGTWGRISKENKVSSCGCMATYNSQSYGPHPAHASSVWDEGATILSDFPRLRSRRVSLVFVKVGDKRICCLCQALYKWLRSFRAGHVRDLSGNCIDRTYHMFQFYSFNVHISIFLWVWHLQAKCLNKYAGTTLPITQSAVISWQSQ